MILKPRRAAEDVQRKEKMTKGSFPGGYHITSQRHTIKTQNPANRTSNVAVFAPVGADRADIANAVHRGDLFMKLKRMRGFIETYEYNADGNWLGYTPDESSVRDRQLWH